MSSFDAACHRQSSSWSALALVSCLAASGCAVGVSHNYLEIGEIPVSVADATTVRNLRVRTNVGDVTIEHGANSQIEIVAKVSVEEERGAQVTSADAERDVRTYFDGEVFVVENAHLEEDDQNDWHVAFHVRVPTLQIVQVSTGVGKVRVVVPCDRVKASSGVGDVLIDGPTDSAELSSGTGNVELRARSLTSATLESGTGSVTLITEAGPSGHSVLSSGTGNLLLTVGADFDGTIDLSTGIGKVRLHNTGDVKVEGGLVSDRARGALGSGPAKLQASTGTGSIEFSRRER